MDGSEDERASMDGSEGDSARVDASEGERARVGGSAEESDRGRAPLSGGQAVYLYAIVRARSWRGRRIRQVEGAELVQVRYRDLEALVRAVPYELPPGGEEELRAHQRVVDAALRRGAVLPLPYGVVFQGRRQLIRLLQEQYLVIDEALSFVAGAWEVRLHMAAAAGEQTAELGDIAMQCYTELRRHARAAVPLAGEEGKRLLTAAFLVERTTWIEFVERADDLGSAHPELTFDVTGPWPPYDFVRISL